MTTTPQIPAERIESTRRFAQRVAWVLDSSIRVPILGWRFGIQPIISLVPVAGDVAGFALTLLIIGHAVRVKAPPGLLLRMAGNAVFDLFLGLVPAVGDVADFVFKANTRNSVLLQRHLDTLEGQPPPTAPWRRWLALATVILVLGLAAWLAWQAGAAVLGWLLGAIGA